MATYDEERAKVTRDLLPGVGNPVVGLNRAMDTGAQYGPSWAPFTGQGLNQVPQPQTAPMPAVDDRPKPLAMPGQTAPAAPSVAQRVATAPAAASGLPKSPSPNISYSSLVDESGRQVGVREIVNGGFSLTPPSVANGFGFTKPIEQQVADTARYKQTVDAYRAFTGQVPLDQAQAGYYDAKAADVPLDSQSAQGLRTAQSNYYNAMAEQGKTVQVPYEAVAGVNDLTKEPIIVRRTGLWNNGQFTDPFATGDGGLRNPQAEARSAVQALTAEKQSVVAKHFGSRTDVTPDEILTYVRSLQ